MRWPSPHFLQVRRPPRIPRAERGALHGLSLLAITLAFVVVIAVLTMSDFPVRCLCADGKERAGKRGGFDSANKACAQVCADRGGGKAIPLAKPKDSKKR